MVLANDRLAHFPCGISEMKKNSIYYFVAFLALYSAVITFIYLQRNTRSPIPPSTEKLSHIQIGDFGIIKVQERQFIVVRFLAFVNIKKLIYSNGAFKFDDEDFKAANQPRNAYGHKFHLRYNYEINLESAKLASFFDTFEQASASISACHLGDRYCIHDLTNEKDSDLIELLIFREWDAPTLCDAYFGFR
jgi:hypothetical protein